MAESGKTGSQAFGDLLRLARERKGISRRELAEATNLSYPYISQLETGYRQPSPAAIRNLADVLDLSLDEIFAAIGPRADEPEPANPSAAGTGWIANKTYATDAARAGGMARRRGSAPAPQSAPSPVLAPAAEAGPIPLAAVPAALVRAAPVFVETRARAEAPMPAAAPIPTGPAPAAQMPTAPKAAAIPAALSARTERAATDVRLPQSAITAAPLADTVVDQAVQLLSALPPADRLAAVSAIQQKVIDAVVEERVQLRVQP